MRGHGTYMTDDILYASVAGVVERVNKLISVTPLKTRYLGIGELGFPSKKIFLVIKPRTVWCFKEREN